MPLRKDIWNQVWVADCPGIDGHANTNLVVATNKTCAEGGFICWDFHTTNLKYSLIHSTKFNPDNAQSTSFNMHCHAVCGPLILYTSSGCSETKLFDIRDGEMQCIFPHKYLVQPMQYCSPISWMFETQIVLAHESTISIWDVQGQRSFPTMTFPTVLGSVRAIDMENSKAENVFNEARR